MSLPNIPPELHRMEFSRIHFDLELQEPFEASAEALLRLRQELRQAARQAVGEGACTALFDPPLPVDPLALRRYQRPGPGFVLRPDPKSWGPLDEGESFSLEALFWGDAIRHVDGFAATLEALGRRGFFRSQGGFELTGVFAEDAAGGRSLLWSPGGSRSRWAPPIIDAAWWVADREGPCSEIELAFITPARLLSGGRPLFRPSFARIFPFILRRVTSMAYAHCRAEPIDDPRELLAAAGAVEIRANQLEWQDWRTLEGTEGSQDLGGVGGSVRLAGEALSAIGWVLELGSLLQLGKSAAYGGGCYRLRPAAVA